MPPYFKYLVGLTFVFGLACETAEGDYDHSQYREDTVRCDEAVAHVTSCCPMITAPSTACEFHHLVPRTCGGCSSNHGRDAHDDMEPVLSIDTSNGLIAASCEDISANHGCDVVAKMLQAEHGSADPGSYDCY